MNLAREFALSSDNNGTYIPYILDMIKDDLLSEKTSRKIESRILQIDRDINDYLVGKVCEREVKKLGNIEIDRQVEFFIHLAVKYSGVIHEDHFEKFETISGGESKDNQVDKIKGHPLLLFRKDSKTLSFRYDFFDEYFKTIELARFLREDTFENINGDVIDIITQQVGYDNSFTKNIKKRLGDSNYEDLKLSIWGFLQNIDKIDHLSKDRNRKNRLNSSLFMILLALEDKNSKEDRTSLLKEIYETEGIVENLCIMNLHTSSRRILFDFSGLKFKNCVFENYECFAECTCDGNTYFENTKFVAPLHREGIISNIKREHIDSYSCDTGGIVDVISEIEQLYDDEDLALRHGIKRILRFFWQGSAFKQKLASEASTKLQTVSKILDALVKNKVILKSTVTTKQKRKDKAYSINPEYSNLRKVMEENDTCLEFDRIIHMLSRYK